MRGKKGGNKKEEDRAVVLLKSTRRDDIFFATDARATAAGAPGQAERHKLLRNQYLLLVKW